MNNLNRIGGVSGMLASAMLLLTLLAGIPIFASAPPELFNIPINAEGALAFSARWTPTQRLAFKVLLGSQIAAQALMIPALLALYGALKATRHAYASIGLTFMLGGIVFNFIDALLGMPLTGYYIERFAPASAAERAAMATVLYFIADLQVLTLAWVLMGVGAICFALAMRGGAFPRWLAWLALILGVLGLATMLNQFVIFLPNILAIAWALLLGITLYRKAATEGG